jgi:hypothetical protein
MKRHYRYDLSPTITQIGYTDVDEAGVSDNQGGAEFHGDDDSLMMVGRNGGLEIYTWQSADKGATWTSSGYMNNYGMTTRYDIDRMGTDSISVVVFVNDRYVWQMFNGSTWTAPDTLAYGVNFTRQYATTVGKRGIVHIVWSDESSPNHVIHAWRDTTSGNWTLDTVYTVPIGYGVVGGLIVGMSYSENGNNLRIIYTKAPTGTMNAVVCRRWDYDNNTWFDQELTLSNASATSIYAMSGSNNVPAIHNGRSYFAFTEQVGGSWYWRLLSIIGNSPPTVAGISDQSIAYGGAFTNINLDDAVTDADNSDAQMTWTYAGNTNITIDTVSTTPFVISLVAAGGWSGSNNVTFTATDPDGAYGNDLAVFTVAPASTTRNKVRLRK